MILKRAICELTEMSPIDESSIQSSLQKLSSSFNKDSTGNFNDILKAEIKKHPTALFFRAKAIVADETNSNGDYFAKDELKKSYKTFIGVPFFTNHNNQDVENARGKIVWADWNDKDNAIYVIGFVDREAYPHVCRGIEEEYMRGVSMGSMNGDALITMHDLSYKKIKDVEAGDKVLTPFGNICNVEKVFSEVLGKPMYELEFKSYHKSPLFSDDHPIYIIPKKQIVEQQGVSRKNACKNFHSRSAGKTTDFIGQDGWRIYQYNPEFKEIKDIEVGDYALIPSKYKIIEKSVDFDKDFYYLAGSYIGDGYLSKDNKGILNSLNYYIGLHEKKGLGQRIVELLPKYSNKKITQTPYEEKGGLKICIYDAKIANIMFSKFGKLSHDKRIFQKEFTKDQICSLISGYIDTDGTICKTYNKTSNGSIRGNGIKGAYISSCNQYLLEDVQSLLIAIGVPTFITWNYRTPNKNSVVKIPTLEYLLFIPYGHLRLFNESIKVRNVLDGRGDKPEIKAGKNFIYNGNNNQKYLACYITKINKKEFNEPSYDLKIEEDECYIADGVAVHNCSVEYSVCSICGNKADNVDNYCSHIKYKKGRKFSGQAKDVVTGEMKTFKEHPVYELNYGIKFIELSGVADPACKTCYINDVINNNAYLYKAASAMNNIFMYKESELAKNASQQEVDQLNQVLKTLEDISISLIKNRAQVDVEFASDLVKILSELQAFSDELVGAGFAQLQSAPAVPGVEGQPGAETAMPGATPGGLPTQGLSLEQGLGGEVGTTPIGGTAPTPNVTGAPGTPMLNTPAMPTAPVKPIAKNLDDRLVKISEISEKINLLKNKLFSSNSSNLQQVEGDMKRIPEIVENQKKKVIESLNKSLKENNKLSEYNREDSNGGTKMSQKIASRTEAPEVITQKQLEDQKGGYHPREDSPREEITQSQLKEKRTDDEKEVLTEKQLDSKRTNDAPEVVTQKQLEKVRTDSAPEVITQSQLEDGYRKNQEVEVITEKQLNNKPSDFWTRSSFNRTNVKTAKEHVDLVLNALANTSLESGTTPEQIHVSVKDMIASVKAKTSLLDAITKEASGKENSIDSAERVKYWGNKGIKLASISKKELENIIVTKLNTLVASDDKVNPETVVGVLEVIGEDSNSISRISSAIDNALVKKSEEKSNKSIKDEIKESFNAPNIPVKSSDESKMKRESERNKIVNKLADKSDKKSNKSDYMILTSLDEIGIDKEVLTSDKVAAKKLIAGFTRGACIANNIKLAGITNVKIDEKGRVEIAISTEEGEQDVKVDLPPEGEEAVPDLAAPEGGIEGENLDNMTPPPEVPPLEPGVPPAGAPGAGALGAATPIPPPIAKTENKMKKTAQIPGPKDNIGGGGGATPATPNAIPPATPDPAMAGEGVQALTEGKEDEAGVGEADKPGQFPAGSKCPFCGSSDVDVGGKGEEDGTCECKDCGAKYQITVNIEVLNPKEMAFEEEGKKIPEPEEPELPEMPVAASVKLDKNTMTKLANLEKSKGYVCPSCGVTDCKPVNKTAGHTSCVCPSCETKFDRDVMVNVDKPEESIMMVKWNIDPKKMGKCESCKEAARKFASDVKIARMIKKASEAKFPMANCIERIARKWGSNAVSTFGPCKGKPLADCVCKELERFGLTSIRKMTKLAEAMSQKDPMDQCLEDHMKKGYKKAQASTICNALRKKYAGKADNNIFIMAWADEPDLKEGDLEVMKNKTMDDEFEKEEAGIIDEGDIGDELPPIGEEEVSIDVAKDIGGEETITIELPKDIAKDIADQIEETEIDVDTVVGEPDLGSASTLDVSSPKEEAIPEEEVEGVEFELPAEGEEFSEEKVANSIKLIKKEAKRPEKVESIEVEVEAKIPRGNAELGNESKTNIDVTAVKPSIPEGKATMGEESKDNIDVTIDLPDIPVGDAYMGGEKEAQAGLPANNVKIKGTVIAEKKQEIIKEATTPTQVKHMEEKVEIPRGDATMGHEGKDNINVAEKEPAVPRGDAKMGHESAENIDKPVAKVDVPTGDAYMGKEKEVQSNMPKNTVESLGTVRASDEKREKQLERLALARYQKACLIAAKLLGEGRIKSEDMEDVVKDLSKLEIDRIESFANKIYPRMVKTASSETLTQPIVIEAKGIETPQPESLKDKLESMFTVGSKKLNDALDDSKKI